MYRATSGYYGTILGKIVSCPNIQAVRFRKPRFMPPAKSKMFIIRDKPVIPDEENKELQRLYNNHKTALRSLSKFFINEFAKESATGEIVQRRMQLQAEEHERLMEYNRQENTRVAKLREERVAREWAQHEEALLQKAAEFEEQRERDRLIADQIVREAKKVAATSVSYEHLDAAIEKALESVVTYNFAVDLEGNILQEDMSDIKPVPTAADIAEGGYRQTEPGEFKIPGYWKKPLPHDPKWPHPEEYRHLPTRKGIVS